MATIPRSGSSFQDILLCKWDRTILLRPGIPPAGEQTFFRDQKFHCQSKRVLFFKGWKLPSDQVGLPLATVLYEPAEQMLHAVTFPDSVAFGIDAFDLNALFHVNSFETCSKPQWRNLRILHMTTFEFLCVKDECLGPQLISWLYFTA